MFVINIPYLDLNKIYDSGLAFMWRKINTDDYIVIHKDKAIRVKQLKDTIMLECTENDFFDIWYNYFDCGTDYETIHHNIKNVPNFKLKSEIAKGVRLIKPSLLESIIYAVLDTTPDKARYYIQNIAVSYSKKQLKSIRNIGKVEYYEFPTKQQILDQKKLLNIGVKTEVLIHFLENVNIGYLLNLNYNEALEYLKEKLISRNVAERICLYVLGFKQTLPKDKIIKNLLKKKGLNEKEFINFCMGYEHNEFIKDNMGLFYQYLVYNKEKSRKVKEAMGIIDDIKNDAKGNRTTIQSSEGQELCTILNKLFYLEKNVDKETEFVKQVMTRGAETQERVGLHASALITKDKDFCLRQQVLSLYYKQLQGEQLPVGLMRIFEEGNAIHEKWQRLLIRGGYAEAKDLDYTQFNKEYKISFTPDIICKIPEFYDGLMVGEIKSVNTYQYQKMTKHPSASKQLQLYMYLTGIHKGFVLCEDKNTQDFKCEVYDYDSELVSDYIDRAEQIKYYYNRVKTEKKMVKRPEDAKAPDCKRCNKCAMKNACWNINGGGVRI